MRVRSIVVHALAYASHFDPEETNIIESLLGETPDILF